MAPGRLRRPARPGVAQKHRQGRVLGPDSPLRGQQRLPAAQEELKAEEGQISDAEYIAALEQWVKPSEKTAIRRDFPDYIQGLIAHRERTGLMGIERNADAIAEA